MPLTRCKVNGKPGWRWGQEGKCYTGFGAKKQAIRQGIAIEGPEKVQSMLAENYSESQPRDSQGRFSSGGGSGTMAPDTGGMIQGGSGKGGSGKGEGTVQEAIDKAEALAEKTGVRPNWLDQPVTFQSTFSTGRGKVTHTAVNWRKIEPESIPGRLQKVHKAWMADRDKASGYSSWDAVARISGLSVESVAKEVKALGTTDIAQTVDRMGNATYFKFKSDKLPIHNIRTQVVPSNPLKADPTRTKTLRRAFERELSKRFRKIKGAVNRLLIEEDAFGLKGVNNLAENYNPGQPRDSQGRFASGGGGGGEGGSESVEDSGRPPIDPTSWVDPYLIQPPNPVTDRAKLKSLSESMEKGGWSGEPILTKAVGDGEQGLTGSHRIYAARKVGLDQIPIVSISRQDLDKKANGIPLWEALESSGDTAEMLDVMETYAKRHPSLSPARDLLHKEAIQEGLIENTLGPIQNTRWRFHTKPEQVQRFTAWLAGQIAADIYLNADGTEAAYVSEYIRRGFEKGAGRAFDDTKIAQRAGAEGARSGAEYLRWYQAAREDFLRSSFGQPETREKVQLLAGRTLTDLKNVTDDMATKMSRALTDGLVQGQNPRTIARNINQTVDASYNRAEVIARTETIRAHSEGQLDSLERLGVEEVGVAVEWSTAGDGRVCPLCRSLEGVVLKVKEAHGLIPRHPQCLPGDSLVTTRPGVLAASKRWFDGYLIVIQTASGRKLSCTPNHPILTNLGWVPSEQLNLGSKVVCDGSSEWEGVVDGLYKNVPSPIHYVAESFLGSGQVTTTPVPLSAIDFHGDGIDGQVAVIGTDSSLLFQNDPPSSHSSKDFKFQRRDVGGTSLDGLGMIDFSGHRFGGPTSSFMGSRSLSDPSGSIHLRPLERFSLGSPANGYPSTQQESAKHFPPNPKAVRDGFERFSRGVRGNEISHINTRAFNPGGVVFPENVYDDLLSNSELASKIAGGSTGPVFLDNVVSIDIRVFSGHVYNLQTVEGWFTADGIITHNCRCAFLPANVGEDPKGQERTKRSIESAIDSSIRQEIPQKSKRSIAEQRQKTKWLGADRTIGKKRPESILNRLNTLTTNRLTRHRAAWNYSESQPRDSHGNGLIQ